MNYVYVFDCVECTRFYGDQALTGDGALVCPSCFTEQRIDSPFVERVSVSYTPAPFMPDWQGHNEN